MTGAKKPTLPAEAKTASPTTLVDFFSASEAPLDRWRSLLRVARAIAGSKGKSASVLWSDAASLVRTLAECAKNKMAHRVSLAPQPLDVLRNLREQAHGSPYVFPGSKKEPIANLQKPMRRIRRRKGIEVRFHDLRRTAASHMTGIGISRVVVSKILNHVEQGITATVVSSYAEHLLSTNYPTLPRLDTCLGKKESSPISAISSSLE